MRLQSAMLADAAQVQGGKLFVMGGGFDTISARKLPVVHRSLSLAMVAEIEPDERQRDLELVIRLIDEDGHPAGAVNPQGQVVGLEAKGKLRVGSPPNLPPGSSSIVPIATPFYNVHLPHAKGYAFAVVYGGEELARVRFRVVEVS